MRYKPPQMRIRSPVALLAGLASIYCIEQTCASRVPRSVRERDHEAPGESSAHTHRVDHAAGRPPVPRGLRARGPGAADTDDDASAPSYLWEAIDSCRRARDEFGEYPSVYRKIVERRNRRWKEENVTQSIDFLKMINHKLGGFLYATKAGIPTPRILFCGAARDLNITSLGKSYVVKPLNGHSSRGVKVVKDGVNILSGNKVSYSTLARKPDEVIIVEERIQSAHPNYSGLVPPDYKFSVFRGRPETMWFVDRNKDQQCKDYFDASDVRGDWRHLEDFKDTIVPKCPPRKGPFSRHRLGPRRKAAMADAVVALAGRIGRDWIRIDMFDSQRGPMLGEFTPFSASGKARPLDGCVMSYLFIAHAEEGCPSDDAETLRVGEGGAVGEFKRQLKMTEMSRPSRDETHDGCRSDALGFSPEVVEEWNSSSEREKCEKVMDAQSRFAGAQCSGENVCEPL